MVALAAMYLLSTWTFKPFQSDTTFKLHMKFFEILRTTRVRLEFTHPNYENGTKFERLLSDPGIYIVNYIFQEATPAGQPLGLRPLGQFKNVCNN